MNDLSSPNALQEELARCPILQGLTPEECCQFLSLTEIERYSEAALILREGRSIQTLWIITQGRCEVVKLTKNGGQRQLAVLEPGAVFGELSFFHPAPHSASVRTLTDVEVLRFNREKYDQLLEGNSPTAFKIANNAVRVVADRLRKMDDWTCELVDKSANGKQREEWLEFRAKLYSNWQF